MFSWSFNVGGGKNPRAMVGPGGRSREAFSTNNNIRKIVRYGFVGWNRIKNLRGIGKAVLVEVLNAVRKFLRRRLPWSQNLLCQRIVRRWLGKIRFMFSLLNIISRLIWSHFICPVFLSSLNKAHRLLFG